MHHTAAMSAENPTNTTTAKNNEHNVTVTKAVKTSTTDAYS